MLYYYLEYAEYSQIWFLFLFGLSLYKIFRLDINFTATIVMLAKWTCLATNVFCEVHLAFFYSTLVTSWVSEEAKVSIFLYI